MRPTPLTDSKLLGLTEVAKTPEEVKTAHRRVIRKAHPDAGGSEDLAKAMNAARDRLLEWFSQGGRMGRPGVRQGHRVVVVVKGGGGGFGSTTNSTTGWWTI